MTETFNVTADRHPVSISLICVINQNFSFDTATKIESTDKASEGQSLLF